MLLLFHVYNLFIYVYIYIFMILFDGYAACMQNIHLYIRVANCTVQKADSEYCIYNTTCIQSWIKCHTFHVAIAVLCFSKVNIRICLTQELKQVTSLLFIIAFLPHYFPSICAELSCFGPGILLEFRNFPLQAAATNPAITSWLMIPFFGEKNIPTKFTINSRT